MEKLSGLSSSPLHTGLLVVEILTLLKVIGPRIVAVWADATFCLSWIGSSAWKCLRLVEREMGVEVEVEVEVVATGKEELVP